MMITATTNPKMVMVSRMASMMITDPASSGFSTRLATRRSDLGCAHAVASAGRPMASAAANIVRAEFHALLPFRPSGQVAGPNGRRADEPTARVVELPEELHVVQTQSVNGGTEHRYHQIERVEQQTDGDSGEQ